ncbi:cupin domain-containing protein [Actinomadura luteofluorescens]|uniref:cupin domain-containing protein n=1 Tax=Actinomadura luteofluorescens TaxID=46163 RepID=UPI00363BFAD4
MNALEAVKVGAREVEPNHRLGGSIRMLLSPGTARTTAGLMALLELQPGERVSEHYHPYTDEHVYVSDGRLVLAVNGVEQVVDAREAVLIRRGARHGYENRSDRLGDGRAVSRAAGPEPRHGTRGDRRAAGDGPPPAVDTPPSAAAGAREPA